jgi:hypothetical protein
MKLPKLTALLVCSLILLLPALSVAQDEADSWPIETRCAAEATSPPADWTFDGTIFTQDLDGIRAVNAAFPTPYFVIFSSEFMDGAALSPDGRWYAIPDGYTTPATESGIEFWYDVKKIHFYSTDGKREHHEISWEMSFRPYVGRIKWFDENHIAYQAGNWGDYQWYAADQITGEKTLLELPTESNGSFFAPDPLAPTLSRDHTRYIADGNLVDVATGKVIAQIATDNTQPLIVRWTPDSAYFVGTARIDPNTENLDSRPLGLYDHEGKLLDTISAAQAIDRLEMSQDGRYVTWNTESGNLFVADLNAKTITDYCNFLRYSQVLSPDGKLLAFSMQNTVYIFDLDMAEMYALPYQFPSNTNVIAWGKS